MTTSESDRSLMIGCGVFFGAMVISFWFGFLFGWVFA